MRSSYQYGSYRGKSGLSTFLKGLIAVLVAVLVLVVVVFFVLEPYVVFGSTGVRLELPFLRHEEPVPQVEPVISLPPVAVITPAPTQTSAPTLQTLHAVEVPRSAIGDGTAAQRVRTAGGDAIVLDMKAEDGSLGYLSGLELAKAVGASASDPGLNDAIRALTGGELYTVARVSCFRDNLAPLQRPALGLKSPYGNWRDEKDLRWMNPSAEAARQYLADICKELAALGFSEILLDNSGYPAAGNLGNVKRTAANYDPAHLTPAVTALYGQVRAALADYPAVKLSAVGTEAAVADGADPATGQTLSALSEGFDRIWLPPARADVTDYAGTLAAAGKDPASAMVLLRAEAGGQGESWAILEG